MKTAGINYIKLIIADRALALLLLLFILIIVAYSIYVGVSLRPSDLQVAVHYSSFGETSFYRDKWYYFINFIVVGALMAIAHTVLTVKLFTQGRRTLALAFVWFSILLAVIVWFTTWAVLRVAFL
ncbi:MAG TPA: hypothetical protein VFH06_00365 [Candidatus Saccharimonadales bacterium]|nr:hypothetical protein [Candidatus Saccharimonadales bacterium]